MRADDDELTRFACAVAAPIVVHHGNDCGVLGGLTDPARAAALLDVLFGIQRSAQVKSLLEHLASNGHRADLASYLHHVPLGWQPPAEEPLVVRRADLVRDRIERVGERSTWAWDCARAAVVGGWAVTAGLTTPPVVRAALSPLAAEVVARHQSWRDVHEMVAFGAHFFHGRVDAELDAIVAALIEHAPWPPALGEAVEVVEGEPELSGRSVTIALTVMCPGCGYPAHPTSVAPAMTHTCGATVALTRPWSYTARDVGRFLAEPIGAGERSRDLAPPNVLFEVRRAEPLCPWCDATLPRAAIEAATDHVICAGCAEPVPVRAAGDADREVNAAVRWVVGEGEAPVSAGVRRYRRRRLVLVT